MSKVITSPVKRWPGTVTLADPLTYPQIIAFVDALDAVQKVESPTVITANFAMLPGILKCVEKWDLEGGFPCPPTPETFPASPGRASALLVDWLVREVTAVYQEEDAAPLAG